MQLDIEILVKGVGKLEIPTNVSEGFGVPITFNISDIRDIGSRKASFSKTIKILGSKENNRIFNYLYEIKGLNFNFNMTRTHECVLLVNKNPVMNGFLVLKKISKILIGNKFEVVYEVNIFDMVKTFFDVLGNKKLSDLDFSSGYTYSGTTNITYDTGDHLLNAQLISTANSSLNPSYTQVFTYPFVDYGYYTTDGTFPTQAIDVSMLYPAVFEKAIWDKIFVDAGFSYESEFLDAQSYSGFFGKMINIYNRSTEFRNVQFAEYTSDGSVIIEADILKNIQLGRFSNSYQNYFVTNYYELSSDTLATVNVNPNTETTTLMVSSLLIPEDGDYEIVFRVDVFEDMSGTQEFPYDYTITEIQSSQYIVYKKEAKNDEITQLVKLFPDDMKTVTGMTSGEYSWYHMEVITTELKKGDFIFIRIIPGEYMYYDPIELKHLPQGSQITLNGISLEGVFKKELPPQYSGITYTGYQSQHIKINEVLPEMTQVDFVRNIIKMANLYIWGDKIDDKKLYIEPRDVFYTKGELLNWTDKIDYGQEVAIHNMNDSISNSIKFEHQEGDDYYSQQYIYSNGETYGNKEVDLDNNYLKDSQEVKLDYQSYIMRTDEFWLTKKTYPILYDVENPFQNWFSSKIEYAPMVAFINNQGNYAGIYPKLAAYIEGGRRNANARVSWAAHAKVLGGLSFDLNFQTTGYSFEIDNYDSDRGLYKIFWENFINNITSEGSRMVVYYLNLELKDILKLDFRDRIIIDGQSYFIEKIEYDITNIGSSKVTLIKEIDPIEEGGFDLSFLLKNDTEYILTNDTDGKIII